MLRAANKNHRLPWNKAQLPNASRLSFTYSYVDNKHTWSSAQLCERGCICHQHWTWGQPFLDCRTLSSEPLQPSGSHLALEENPPAVETVLVLRQLSFLFVFYTNNPQFVVSSLTHRHEAPHNGWRSEAGKDVVCVGEVREVWQDNGLAPALTPHKNLEEEWNDNAPGFFWSFF